MIITRRCLDGVGLAPVYSLASFPYGVPCGDCEKPSPEELPTWTDCFTANAPFIRLPVPSSSSWLAAWSLVGFLFLTNPGANLTCANVRTFVVYGAAAESTMTILSAWTPLL